MSAKLILTRKGEWFNRRQIFKVFINEKEAGAIKNDSTEEYVLEPGTYTIQCKHNWMSSPEYSVELKENTKHYLQVGNAMKLIVPLYIMMLVGIFFPLFFKFSKIPLPEFAAIVKLVLILPALIYIILYITLLRKKYLVLGEDNNNPFR